MSVLTELSAHLEAQGIGTRGTDLFVADMPQTPDACTVIYEYASRGPYRAFTSALGSPVAERVRIQVVCRAKTYSAARTKAKAVWDELENFSGTLSSVEYLWIEAITSPFLFKKDENERELVATNYEITKKVS